MEGEFKIMSCAVDEFGNLGPVFFNSQSVMFDLVVKFMFLGNLMD